jgi:hypothetical protein
MPLASMSGTWERGHAIDNTPDMSAPPETGYHRWLGYHAPSMRRAQVTAGIGLVVVLLLLP